MRAVFPAGTVSGAPKVRAMQAIAELEGERRGPYGGAVGYFSPSDVECAITIRSALIRDGMATVHAGAGIVADSVPEREAAEVASKAASMLAAIGGRGMRVFLLDNYDSFTYNLVQLLARIGADVTVARNDQVTVAEVEAQRPDAIVISPGPSRPEKAGISVELVQRLGPSVPMLGVCLGHQAIGVAYGATVMRVPPVHGKARPIHHAGAGSFARPAVAVRRRPLSLAGGEHRRSAGRARGHRLVGGRRDHGSAASVTSGGGLPVPSRVDPDRPTARR